jgi:hypothetical protein
MAIAAWTPDIVARIYRGEAGWGMEPAGSGSDPALARLFTGFPPAFLRFSSGLTLPPRPEPAGDLPPSNPTDPEGPEDPGGGRKTPVELGGDRKTSEASG